MKKTYTIHLTTNRSEEELEPVLQHLREIGTLRIEEEALAVPTLAELEASIQREVSQGAYMDMETFCTRDRVLREGE